jgi:hypothetical protein
MSGEEGKRSFEEGDGGRGALVCVDLGVGETRVIVDDRMHEVVADPRLGAHPVAGALRAIAGDPVARA